MNPDFCDDEVYKNGVSLGFFDMPKKDADNYCKKLTEETGNKHDWHYSAGRVHVKVLIPADAKQGEQK